MIDKLCSNCLMRHAPVPEDRRHHTLMPAKAGIGLLDGASQSGKAHDEQIFGRLQADERTELIKLRRLVWVSR